MDEQYAVLISTFPDLDEAESAWKRQRLLARALPLA